MSSKRFLYFQYGTPMRCSKSTTIGWPRFIAIHRPEQILLPFCDVIYENITSCKIKVTCDGTYECRMCSKRRL